MGGRQRKFKELDSVTHKVCVDCERLISRSAYSPSSRALDGLASVCNACQSLRARDRRARYAKHNVEQGSSATVKTCGACGHEKSSEDFYLHRSNRDGLMWDCRACCKRRHQASRYGLSKGELSDLLSAADGKCAICSEPFPLGRAPSIDHDHETGEVRGVLCGACNMGLGHFRDRPDLLLSAVTYLEDTYVTPVTG